MDWLDDPVDARVATDSFVLGVDQYDLEVLVCGVLIDPIRIKHSNIGTTTSDALLGGRFEGPLIFELIDTLVGWFAWIPYVRRWKAHRTDQLNIP